MNNLRLGGGGDVWVAGMRMGRMSAGWDVIDIPGLGDVSKGVGSG